MNRIAGDFGCKTIKIFLAYILISVSMREFRSFQSVRKALCSFFFFFLHFAKILAIDKI